MYQYLPGDSWLIEIEDVILISTRTTGFGRNKKEQKKSLKCKYRMKERPPIFLIYFMADGDIDYKSIVRLFDCSYSLRTRWMENCK